MFNVGNAAKVLFISASFDSEGLTVKEGSLKVETNQPVSPCERLLMLMAVVPALQDERSKQASTMFDAPIPEGQYEAKPVSASRRPQKLASCALKAMAVAACLYGVLFAPPLLDLDGDGRVSASDIALVFGGN